MYPYPDGTYVSPERFDWLHRTGGQYRYVHVSWDGLELSENEDAITGGSIDENESDSLKCSGQVTSCQELSIGNDLLRIYLVADNMDNGTWTQKPLGTFLCITPETEAEETKREATSTLYSMLKVLYDWGTEISIRMPAGTDIIGWALKNTIDRTGLTYSVTRLEDPPRSADEHVWDAGTSFLTVLNDCLGFAGYSPANVDGMGTIIIRPEDGGAPQWTMQDGSDGCYAAKVTWGLDEWDQPNVAVVTYDTEERSWVAVSRNATGNEFSIDAKHRCITKRETLNDSSELRDVAYGNVEASVRKVLEDSIKDSLASDEDIEAGARAAISICRESSGLTDEASANLQVENAVHAAATDRDKTPTDIHIDNQIDSMLDGYLPDKHPSDDALKNATMAVIRYCRGMSGLGTDVSTELQNAVDNAKAKRDSSPNDVEIDYQVHNLLAGYITDAKPTDAKIEEAAKALLDAMRKISGRTDETAYAEAVSGAKEKAIYQRDHTGKESAEQTRSDIMAAIKGKHGCKAEIQAAKRENNPETVIQQMKTAILNAIAPEVNAAKRSQHLDEIRENMIDAVVTKIKSEVTAAKDEAFSQAVEIAIKKQADEIVAETRVRAEQIAYSGFYLPFENSDPVGFVYRSAGWAPIAGLHSAERHIEFDPATSTTGTLRRAYNA